MQFSKQARQMLVVILLVNVLAGLISIAYYRSGQALPFLLGLGIGGGASIIRVILLERTVNGILFKHKNKSMAHWGHLVRLAIAFVAMLIGALLDRVSLLGTVVGIFSYQLGTYTLLSSRKKRQLK